MGLGVLGLIRGRSACRLAQGQLEDGPFPQVSEGMLVQLPASLVAMCPPLGVE